MKIKKFILIGTLFLASCGQLSDVIELSFLKKEKDNSQQSPRILGLQSSAGQRQQGQFKLNASVGSPNANIYKQSGQFKFYGGLQGQIVSQ